MKRHEITEKELRSWVSGHWHQFAASHSADGESNKTFEMSFNGLYRVTDHGRVLYVGAVLASAIAEYNAGV